MANIPVDAARLLVLEARASNHTFLDRLIADWHSGANRFDAPGECYLGVYDGDTLIACGGLNRDPYIADDPAIGRLRHLYVAEAYRGRGVGRHLVDGLIARATAFRRIRLRATPEAVAFYERLGFLLVDESHATHARDLG
ncbi:MAG: GNAT family N-acetyltransferase [Hyphomicrobiaceae bacterium]